MTNLVIFLLTLLLPLATLANVGSIVDLTGSATIYRGKEVIRAALGTTLAENDKVETKNGKVTIQLNDNTRVNVTEHSALVIDKFVYDSKKTNNRLNLRATLGTVRYASGDIAHKNSNAVNIATPTATIAVRGTDFIMSVNEIGSSLVILMPSCESVPVAGVSCSSGVIDVASGSNKVILDRPYQATLIESGSEPTPPITVNLTNTTIGNNLQISPPRTLSGTNVIAAAREAATKTGDITKAKHESASERDDTKEVTHTKSQDTVLLIAKDKEEKPVATEVEGNPYLKKLWKDKSETQQIGWIYESLSDSNKNYVNITLSLETQAYVIVTQDKHTNSWNFSNGRAQGQIIINQLSR